MKKIVLYGILAAVMTIGLCLLLFWGTTQLLRHLPDINNTITTSPTTTTKPSTTTTNPTAPSPASSTAPNPSSPVTVLDTSVTKDGQNLPIFRATIQDLMACYHFHYGKAMYPLEQWRQFPEVSTPCYGVSCSRYEYLADPEIHYYPAISVYTAEDMRICEISLSLSEHDWSQTIEDIYKAQSIQVLSLFLPELTQQQLQELYEALLQDAKNNAYISHSATPVPKVIRTAGSVGCWGYTYSGVIRINIIPADKALFPHNVTILEICG